MLIYSRQSGSMLRMFLNHQKSCVQRYCWWSPHNSQPNTHASHVPLSRMQVTLNIGKYLIMLIMYVRRFVWRMASNASIVCGVDCVAVHVSYQRSPAASTCHRRIDFYMSLQNRRRVWCGSSLLRLTKYCHQTSHISNILPMRHFDQKIHMFLWVECKSH